MQSFQLVTRHSPHSACLFSLELVGTDDNDTETEMADYRAEIGTVIRRAKHLVNNDVSKRHFCTSYLVQQKIFVYRDIPAIAVRIRQNCVVGRWCTK